MDDNADLFAILGLAGAGLGLMLVGSLNLTGVAIVLAIIVPALVTGLVSVIATVLRCHSTVSHSTARTGRNASTAPR
jgi:hypothetical protein